MQRVCFLLNVRPDKLDEYKARHREVWPEMVHGDVRPPDLDALGKYMQAMTASGLITPDAALERKVREVANLPEAEERLVTA